MELRTTHIDGLGYYDYSTYHFDKLMCYPKPELLARVIERCAEERGDRTLYRKRLDGIRADGVL